MNYQEIIDTIEVGDYVEVKGDPDIEDGVYPVVGLDDKEDYPSMLVCVLVDAITHMTWWLYLSSIVRKVSPTDKQQELSTTEAQDSQNENDSSQSGSGIVVGSAWIFTSEDDEDGFSKGKIYRLSETDEEGYFGVVNDWEETIWFSDNGISIHFKPADQSTDTMKEQLDSEEVSCGVGVYDNILCALQYDPKDVAFTSESFPVRKAVYSVDIPSRHEQPRNKYDREIVKGVFVDVYDVLDAFQVTDPCLQHLIKKALAVGIRGHKDAQEDYTDILDSAKRALEKYEEKSL